MMIMMVNKNYNQITKIKHLKDSNKIILIGLFQIYGRSTKAL